jgi:hypothetical protein
VHSYTYWLRLCNSPPSPAFGLERYWSRSTTIYHTRSAKRNDITLQSPCEQRIDGKFEPGKWCILNKEIGKSNIFCLGANCFQDVFLPSAANLTIRGRRLPWKTAPFIFYLLRVFIFYFSLCFQLLFKVLPAMLRNIFQKYITNLFRRRLVQLQR